MGRKTTQGKRDIMESSIQTQLYRITDVCARLAISRSSVYREIEAGNLCALRIGKSLRVSSVELERYVSVLNSRTPEIA
jgi:excisionase family DNA binding protein